MTANTLDLGQPPNISSPASNLQTIEEGKQSSISILPQPNEPLGKIADRDEIVAREERKKKAKDPKFDDFSAPFSDHGSQKDQ